MFKIKTDRLTVETIQPADYSFILDLLNSPTWLEYIGDRNIHTREQAEKYIVQQINYSYQKNNFGLYKIVLKRDKIPVGMVGFIQRTFLDFPDLGFAVLPKYEGNGYVREAALATLEYGIEKLEMQHLMAITTDNNLRSIALLKQLGFEYVKRITPNELKEPLELFELNLNQKA